MRARGSYRLLAIGAAACLSLALTVLPEAAHAAASCQGKPATIVAGPNDILIVGTNNDDVIVGNAKANIIKGFAAEDLICAGGGDDLVKAGGGNDTVYGGDGDDELRGGPSHDTLYGEAGTDTLLGGRGWFDFMIGGPGDDTMDGGTGVSNTVDFRTAPGPVDVNLTTGLATGDGSDTLLNVGDVRGSAFDDTLVGSTTEDGNLMDGGPGNDLIDGGGGPYDTVMTCDATGPVTIDLVSQTSTGEGTDTLVNMVNAYGGIYGDTLIGNDEGQAIFASCFFFQYDHPVPAENSVDVIHAGGGDDFFAGFGGDNVYDGGPGVDFAAFGEAHGPVTIDLAAGTAVTANVDGPPSTDSLTGVENVFGSYGYSDVISGNSGNNWMFGLGGDDQISGGAGDDWLGGEHFFNLNDGSHDTLDGQDGFDNCTGGETVTNCESTDPPSTRIRLTKMEKLSLLPAGARPRAHVRVVEFGYSPKTISVAEGTKVIWKSETTIEHDITLRDGSWESQDLEEGDTAAHIFQDAGKYRYYCSIHPFMKAKVIVESG